MRLAPACNGRAAPAQVSGTEVLRELPERPIQSKTFDSDVKWFTGGPATQLNPNRRMNHVFTKCVRITSLGRIRPSAIQYAGGNGTKPRKLATQENGSAIPIAAITIVVVISAALARLSRNEILAVRMIWMMKVWVSRDSTN